LSAWERDISGVFRILRLDSIKSKIIVFALLATLIPSLSTAVISYRQNKRALTEKITEELESVSSQTARELDLWQKERFFDVRVFAGSYEVTENLEAAGATRGGSIRSVEALGRLNDYLNSVRERFTDYDELLVIDPQSEVVATSAEESGAVHLPEDWLDQVRSNGTIQGEAYWDEQLDKAVVTIAVSIMDASTRSRFLGALTAKLSFDQVRQILTRFAPGEAGELYVIDSGGRPVISSRLSSAELMQAQLDTATIRMMLGSENAPVRYTSYAGSEVVGTLRPVPRMDWSVIAELPRQEAYAQVARLRNVTLLLVSVLLLGVGLIAYFLGLVIVRPLDRLSKGAGEVAGGDLAVDLPVMGGGEVAYLTEVFNDMVARLREGRLKLDAIHETLREKNEALERLSVTDALTGLYNRRHLMETLTNEVSRSRRHKRSFGILMIDVDRFKKYNDTYGHQAGDDVLARVGVVLKESTRDVDCAARYGGEEFLVMLAEADLEGSVEVAERIRERLAQEKFGSPDKEVAVTLSIGVAKFPEDGDTPEAVTATADAALYQAKRKGRNRVVRATRKATKKAKKEA
jgi:diguanylate cyclase (GGDEF)-like protein